MSHKEYSGVALSQNQKPGPSDWVSVNDSAWRFQEFYLPSDFKRGTEAGEQRIPDLTGIQLLIDSSDPEAASIDWTLDLKLFGSPWETLASGTATGTHADGTHWANLYFDNPVPINETIAVERFRFGFRATAGVERAWFSVPNPLALVGNAKAYAANGTTPLTSGGNEYSFAFRILALTADEGIDFLGNRYRSVVIENGSDNVATTSGSFDEKVFLSAPQPSRFAVVSQYFDQTIDGQPQVVDSVLLDPITPGIYFHIYYSDEGDPATTIEDWENKLWTLVPRTYQAVKRDNYALPEPISAKYIKIEYTQLQAKSYSPGNFEQPILYKKHPKWVLDYFLARSEAYRSEQSSFIAERVGVVYNALDLAYNYYLDDIRQAPEDPVAAPDSSLIDLQRFLSSRTDLSDQVDAETLAKINLSFKPYLDQPALLSKPADYLLAAHAFTVAASDPEYPAERDATTSRDLQELKNMAVVFEHMMPVMFFYLTCRHHYREVSATFDYDRAYFVGIREVVFQRNHYTQAADTSLYIEAGADFINTERNDFVAGEQGLVVDA